VKPRPDVYVVSAGELLPGDVLVGFDGQPTVVSEPRQVQRLAGPGWQWLVRTNRGTGRQYFPATPDLRNITIKRTANPQRPATRTEFDAFGDEWDVS
jgi:hypothetical protein